MLQMKHIFLKLGLICLVKCDKEYPVWKGEIGQIKQFPHSAFLNVHCEDKDHPGWICGSSVVNQRIILTAAHCVDSCINQATMTISVGHRHRGKWFVSSVQSIFTHDMYDKAILAYDIALLRLTTDLKFSYDVRRVALMENPPYFEKAQVADWGWVNLEIEPEKGTKILHYVDQYVWSTYRCTTAIGDVPKGIICASSNNSKNYKYPSRGDSGSALVVRGYIQIGIVSYKMPHISQSLVVYTDTGFFYDWIKKNSKKLYCVIERP